MSYVSLSDRAIAAVPFAVKGQQILRDADLSGFFVLVGTRSKSFMIQGDMRSGSMRRSIRMKVGEAGKITTREARARAKTLLGQIADGVDPRPKASAAASRSSNLRDRTLQEAWNAYRDGHMRKRGRSEKTIEGYADHVERLMKNWLDTPLSILGEDPSLVKEFHDNLSETNGPYMANVCMRTFRAIYNHARKAARGLPAENPAYAIDWNPEHRRETGLGAADLTGWFDQLRNLDNPLRRELHLFLLLSGSRPSAIKCAKIEHLNFRERLLFVPEPKGGAAKAFHIPLSRQMMRCLVRAIAIGRMMYPGQSNGWLFPADSAVGHATSHRERRALLSNWGNELRQTYRTIGQIAGINDVDMHLLMNHSLPGVNAGYITRHKLVGDHLRAAQQKISDTIFAAICKYEGSRGDWPHVSVRRICA